MKIGDKVRHDIYGEGEVVTVDDKTDLVGVVFNEEHEIVINDVTDERYYFEDNTRLETTNFIEVPRTLLTNTNKFNANKKYKKHYTNNCHSCKKIISSNTHPYCDECNWLKCDCGSCRCNYSG